jgi:UTP--glucose-1-phosphate uridylyltransferase
MKVTKAVITAAGPGQHTLPLQVLIDRDGVEKPLLRILVEEAVSAGIEEIAVVVAPGDEKPYLAAIGDADGVAGSPPGIPGRAALTFILQERPLGYGHAVYCAHDFVGGEPFLHLVGDHLYVSDGDTSCARQLVEAASTQECAVSAVQATRESLLPYFGAIGGRRVQGRRDLYVVETVVEKPAPTEAELRLTIPGLRAGHYLCFFGMHVLTPTIMDILAEQVAATSEATSRGAQTEVGGAQEVGGRGRRTRAGSATSYLLPPTSVCAPLSAALATLAGRERYLALEERAWRYDVGVRYGILNAQLALALSGKDRAEVLSLILDLLAQRDLGATRR